MTQSNTGPPRAGFFVGEGLGKRRRLRALLILLGIGRSDLHVVCGEFLFIGAALHTTNGDTNMMGKNTEHRLSYTVEAACDATSLARTRIYRAIADGTLKTFKAGRRRMVSAKALQSFIDALERQSEDRAAA